MRLTQPTDFEILEAVSDGKRNTGANIAMEKDIDRGYVNAQLPKLADYGLLKKIGPAEKSGLYQITTLGMIAVRWRDKYEETEDFETKIKNKQEMMEQNTESAKFNR